VSSAALLSLLCAAAAQSSRRREDLRLWAKTQNRVVILVHGWRFGIESWRAFARLAKSDDQLQDCQLHRFAFSLRRFRRSSFDDIAKQLSTVMSTDFAGREIVLVGVDAGALIAIRACVDYVRNSSRQTTAGLRRIVLLSAPSHGFGAHRRPPQLWIRRWLWSGGLRDAMEGSDFLINLRFAWLWERTNGRLDANVVQIRSANDPYLTKADVWDVDDKPGICHVVQEGSLLKPSDSSDTPYLVLKNAVLGEDPSELAAVSSEAAPTPHPLVFLFLVPGIRDFGFHWRAAVEALVREHHPDAEVIGGNFGWFSAWDFMWRRSARVRQWADVYTRHLGRVYRSPDAVVAVLAHSYGTYSVVRALERYPDMRLGRLYLAGNVLPREYTWPVEDEQYQEIVVSWGSRDFWTGIFSNALGRIKADVGGGGFLGFEYVPERMAEVPLNGGHSAFTSHLGEIVAFLVRGTPITISGKVRRSGVVE
jgi:pimeloyl-ACP methyl ester carboxylesterase